jgi:hypothetical protein
MEYDLYGAPQEAITVSIFNDRFNDGPVESASMGIDSIDSSSAFPTSETPNNISNDHSTYNSSGRRRRDDRRTGGGSSGRKSTPYDRPSASGKWKHDLYDDDQGGTGYSNQDEEEDVHGYVKLENLHFSVRSHTIYK